MRVKECSPNANANDMTLSNKVTGEFASRTELESFESSLDAIGIDCIEVFQGTKARECVAKMQESPHLGDLEPEMLREYELALGRGHLVFAVPDQGNKSDEVVRLARLHGAQSVAHFGTLINESY